MHEHFDALETRDPDLRERALMDALPRQIAHAKTNAPAFARILADVDPAAVTSRAALAAVPVTRKSDLLDTQKASRPFGGLAALKRGEAARKFSTSLVRSGSPGQSAQCSRNCATRRTSSAS